ncbi:PilN domain-containing protein, partial [Acidobacteria bacterium ACD]|nr:PilN domain-containing protein [Acidobacteria bacterium ACD]
MIKINLLPEAKPTKKKKGVSALGGGERLNVILLVGAVVVGLLVIGVQWWIYRSQIKELDEKIRRDQLEVARLESILREVKDFEDKKAKLQKKVDLINQLKQNQKGPVRLMDEVSNALPDLLWLEKMEYKGTTITLAGKALNPPAVANFLENLKKVSAFQEPKVQDISAASARGAALYNF